MAVQISKQRVCDLCGSREGIVTYRVGVVGKGRGVSPDLCEEHGEPIREAMAAVPRSRSTSSLRKAPPLRTEAQVRKLRKRA